MTAQSIVVAKDLPIRLLATLEVRKRDTEGPYPLSIRELAQFAGPEISPEQVHKALARQPTKVRIVRAHPKSLDAPLAFAEDATQLAQSDKLLEFALELTCTSTKPTCTSKNLQAKVAKPLQAEFVAAIERRLMEGRLPSTVGQRTKGRTKELYLRRMPPLEEVLAEKMLVVLESQRTLGNASYPLPRARLVELTDSKAKKTIIAEAFKNPVIQGKLLIVDLKKAGCLIAFQQDQDQVLKSAKLVEFLIHANRKANEQAFAVDNLGKGTPLKSLIVDALKAQIETNSLPPTVGWMWIGKKQCIFLIDDVRRSRQTEAPPAPAPGKPAAQPVSSGDFARAFDETFTRLDHHHGSHNFVHLKEIRKALPFSRDAFDAHLRELRLAGRYTLSAAEGRHGLTAEEREAGIVEDGSLLLYVSRRLS